MNCHKIVCLKCAINDYSWYTSPINLWMFWWLSKNQHVALGFFFHWYTSVYCHDFQHLLMMKLSSLRQVQMEKVFETVKVLSDLYEYEKLTKRQYLSKYTSSNQWHLSVPACLWGRHRLLKTQSSLWKGLLSVEKRKRVVEPILNYCKIFNQSYLYFTIILIPHEILV